ncbi:MAG: inositol-1-monophosphatase [Thiotrichaceae bacterium]|nr:inositol-1-monophosphatase [Thiotrichaceae bacterium]
MHPTLNIAVRAARSAGNIIMRNMDRIDSLNVTAKGKNDFVCDVDKMAEAEIVATIRKAFPDHGIYAEEGTMHKGDEYRWIIDPLDGTTNYLHGFPQFSVSIALQCNNRIEQAVVYNPLHQELFTATRGGGAFLNDKRIRVSNAKGLNGSLLGTGFPFRNPQYLDAYLETFKVMHLQTAGIRRAGSAALDLAYVASGRLDGFWEIALKPWDMAAGILLVQEAGGLVGDFSGGHDFLETGNLVVGNPKIFKAILQGIQPHLTEELKK